MTVIKTGAPARILSVFEASRALLLLCLAVIYGGCLQFFITFSPALLYGTYIVIIGCLLACLWKQWQVVRKIESVITYLIWIFAYVAWASFVSRDETVVSEGIRVCIKNAILITALAMAVDSDTLPLFSNLVQLAVVANCALSLWETFDPELVRTIALTRQEDATAFNVLRPAGLWSNPDEAAFAIIFALLLSYWASPKLALVGRLMGGIALVLTASRTGTYLLLICALVIAAGQLRKARPAIQLMVCCSILLAGGGLLFFVNRMPAPDVGEHGEISRIFDIHESTREPDAASRLEIATTAAFTALEHPWYGSGLFTFQCEGNFRSVLEVPAHNIYLTVWGEAGPVNLAAYLMVLGFSMGRSYRALSPGRDCTILMLMWTCYLIIGVTWHNQVTSFSGMLYIALLMHIGMAIHQGRMQDVQIQSPEASV